MTKTIRISDPVELLALIPFQLGFTPNNSLVLVSLQSPNNQLGIIARCDLWALSGEAGEQMVDTLVAKCLDAGSDCVFIVLYADHENQAVLVTGELGVVTSNTELLAVQSLVMGQLEGRIKVESTWVVGPRTFYPWSAYSVNQCQDHCGRACGIECSEPCAFECDLHEPDGRIRVRSVAELRESVLSAELIASGHSYKESLAKVGIIERVAKRERDRYGAAFRRHEQRCWDAIGRGELATWELESLHGWDTILHQMAYWEHTEALCWGADCRVPEQDHTGALVHERLRSITPAQLGKIGSGIMDRRVRDAVLLSLTPRGIESAFSFLRSNLDICGCAKKGEAVCILCPTPLTNPAAEFLVQEALALIVSDTRGVRPTLCQIRIMQMVLTRIVAHSKTANTAPGLTLLSLIEWWQGSGATARRFNESALSVHPDYRLAKLLEQALHMGLPPGWARRANL